MQNERNCLSAEGFALQGAGEAVEAIGPQIVHESIRLTVSIEVHGFTVDEDLMDRLLLAVEKANAVMDQSGKR